MAIHVLALFLIDNRCARECTDSACSLNEMYTIVSLSVQIRNEVANIRLNVGIVNFQQRVQAEEGCSPALVFFAPCFHGARRGVALWRET